MQTRHRKGFTLLELLVVVGLVAAAAAIVAAALNDARNSGRDTGIKANLANIRQHAESDHLGTGHYNSVCGNGSTDQNPMIAELIRVAELESPGTAVCASEALAETQGWAISLELASSGYWCVDATGFSGEIPGPLDHANDVSCQ